ncbi:MAG: aminopeptidase [Pseudomonadota bacterium]
MSDDPTLPRDLLERYAEAIVGSCLHVAHGDLLLVRAAPEHRELTVALAEAGYRHGARHVELQPVDDALSAARVRRGDDGALGGVAPWSPMRHPELRAPTTASVRVTGEAEDVFEGLPPERVGAELAGIRRHERPWLRAGMEGRRRGTVAAWPTSAWAARVHPGVPDGEARRRLALELLAFCRLGPDDEPDAWDAHTRRLAARGRALTDARLVGLELRGPGTRLDLRLAPGVRWLGGPRVTTFGATVTPNFPTEENFTSPLAPSVEGTFRCSRPLVLRGRLIEGISGELRRGRLVRLDASDPDARDFLAAQLDLDAGARRLGEIALVDRTSRIGRTGRVYLNTLLDENAAAHIAFGAAYAQTRPPETGRAGLNRSARHVDVMIGTEDFEATGVRDDGSRVPLIVDGTWQIEGVRAADNHPSG